MIVQCAVVNVVAKAPGRDTASALATAVLT